ncbi:MarR family transcriptional regulator [Actinocatenispora sera]|uniref:MarR family winged helix-turn-helix transcriptional regulator n=1 Tax=Actinocatenispora sera TaxID=390989 RepID=UPI0033C7D1CA
MAGAARGAEGGTPDIGELLGRELSTAVVMFHEAVAARRGLTATENKALDLLTRRGPVTSGELARGLGLTPGAVTGLVDRLARAGYARRVADAADRRKMLVLADAERLERELRPAFAPLSEAVEDLTRRYTPEQLEAIGDFLAGVTQILRDQTTRLTGDG